MFCFTTIRRNFGGFIAWFKRIHSDQGEPSFSRYAQGLVLLNTLAWVWYSLIKHAGVIPDLGGPAMFVSGGALSHYGVGKWAETMQKGSNIPDKDSVLKVDSPATV